MIARLATPDDADELVRLRAVMLRSGGMRVAWNDDWREPARQSLRRRLTGPASALSAYVVDRPAGPSAYVGDRPAGAGLSAYGGDRPAGAGLAACAVGLIEERLGSPANPSGTAGYIFSVATDPDQRRRGYARACLEGLLGWFRSRGVRAVDLRASAEGAPLYEQLGFVLTPDPAMRLRL